MGVTLTYDFNTDALTKARLQTSLDELATACGQISNRDIVSAAAIPQSKLSAVTGTFQIEVPISLPYIAGGWPTAAAGILTGIALEESIWTVKGYKFLTNDIGAGIAAFGLNWGYMSGATFTVVTTVKASASIGGSYSGSGVLDVALGSVSPGSIGVLGLWSTSAVDGTMLAAAGDLLTVSVILERAISL